jgi:hypothetical protein
LVVRANGSLIRLHLDALVSGRNKARREAALVAMLSQAFFDESGGLDQPSFVLGGWVGGVEMWKQFSDDWQAVLDWKPELPPFHAAPFERCEEGFEPMADRKLRAARLNGLIDVLEKHKPAGVLVCVPMDEFKRRIPEQKRREAWTYPYVYAAAQLVGILTSLHEFRRTDFGTVEVVFDYIQQFHARTKRKIEENVRLVLQADAPKLARRLGEVHWPPLHLRENYVPLQAADMLVWHQRRARDERDGETRRAWRRLKAMRLSWASSRPDVDNLGVWIKGHKDFGPDLTPRPMKGWS